MPSRLSYTPELPHGGLDVREGKEAGVRAFLRGAGRAGDGLGRAWLEAAARVAASNALRNATCLVGWSIIGQNRPLPAACAMGKYAATHARGPDGRLPRVFPWVVAVYIDGLVRGLRIE